LLTSYFFWLGAPGAFGPVAAFAVEVVVCGLGAGALAPEPLAFVVEAAARVSTGAAGALVFSVRLVGMFKE
jgi:hypothetical protein